MKKLALVLVLTILSGLAGGYENCPLSVRELLPTT